MSFNYDYLALFVPEPSFGTGHENFQIIIYFKVDN